MKYLEGMTPPPQIFEVDKNGMVKRLFKSSDQLMVIGGNAILIPGDLIGNKQYFIQACWIGFEGGMALNGVQHKHIVHAKNLGSKDTRELLMDNHGQALLFRQDRNIPLTSNIGP